MYKDKAILFDLDGVLVNTMDVHKKAFQDVLCDLGVEVTKQLIAGRSTRQIIKEVVEDFGLEKNAIDELVNKKQTLARELIYEEGARILAPGLDILVPALAKEYKLVICTSGSPESIELFYKFSSLREYFFNQLSQVDVAECKPSPEVYLKAVDNLKLEKKNCYAVEDSYAGCLSASRAGVKLVIMKTDISPDPLDFSGSYQIDSLFELLNLHLLN
jgi:beta-phosphoglucomutase